MFSIEYIKSQIKTQANQMVIKKRRRKHFLLFIDLKKAFDSVDRTRLIKKMTIQKFNGQLIQAV